MAIMIKQPELLAPAGSLAKLKYALDYGADAVYLGLPDFSLRAKTGFSLTDVKQGIEYAQALKKKVYITVNIFAHQKQMGSIEKHLKVVKSLKPDAVIVSDPGVLSLCQKIMPKIDIHLSTQANTLNAEAASFWLKQGVKRIILGRECSLKDIKAIHKAVPKMELEVFVHGAMCLSYSGRCYLSAWFNARSANQGMCTQPCRWEYGVEITEPKRPEQKFRVEANGTGTYILNSKDLALIEYLSVLKRAGVSCFKIEGRTKSIYYLAVATRAYRLAIEGGDVKELKRELDKIDNRGYTTGFLLGLEEGLREEFATSKASCDWEFAGEVITVKRSAEQNLVKVKVHNTLKQTDLVELVTPKQVFMIKIKRIITSKGESVSEVHGGTKDSFMLELDNNYDIAARSIIRRKK